MTRTQAWIARIAGGAFIVTGVWWLIELHAALEFALQYPGAHMPSLALLFVGLYALWKGFGKVGS